MVRRGYGVLTRFRVQDFLFVFIVCIVLIGAAGAVEFSTIQRPAVQMYAHVDPVVTVVPCDAVYSCMLPVTAAEKGYSISSNRLPCAYIQDSGQLTAEYCFRPSISPEVIGMAQKVYAAGSDGSGSSGGAVETLGPGAAIARAVVVARPPTMICAIDGQTWCPGWGCVDLRTNISNCGSCSYGCYNFTGCRDGKCYTDLSVVRSLPKVAAVELGQVKPFAGIERKALNPQPEPPLVPVRAVNNAGTGNGFFSPILRLFVPAETQGPSTITQISAVNRNRGILESILAIFSPLKNEGKSCTSDKDCPAQYTCSQSKCREEYISATSDKYHAEWGETINFRGVEASNSPSPICMNINTPTGKTMPEGGLVITDAIQPDSDTSFSYAWDTSRPLPNGYTKREFNEFIVSFHIGPCTSSGDKSASFIINLVNKTAFLPCPPGYVCMDLHNFWAKYGHINTSVYGTTYCNVEFYEPTGEPNTEYCIKPA